MSSGNLHGKTLQLGDYILEQIYTGVYNPGMAIPSIRCLMAEFGVSQRTVQRTVEVLVERGILESRQGQGTFVKKHNIEQQSSGRIIAVSLHPGNLENSIYGNIFLGLQQAALDMNCQLKVDASPVKSNTASPNTIKKLVAGTEGLIVLSEQDDRLNGMKLPVPVVGVGMYNNYNDTVSLLDLDPFSTAGLAGDFFRERNFNKVDIFSVGVTSYMMRGRVFAEQWRRDSGECTLSSISMPLTEKYVPSGDRALLFTTGSIKEAFLCHYHKLTGSRLEELCTILELDGKSRINPDFTNTPSIAPDWKQVGRMALEEVLYRVDHPGTPSRRIFVPGKLHLN